MPFDVKHPFAQDRSARMRLSFGLALVVHVALLSFLWVGISWQNTNTPDAVEAEVWDVKVRDAAPLAAGEPALDEGDDNTGLQQAQQQQPQPATQEARELEPQQSTERPDISLGKKQAKTQEPAKTPAKAETAPAKTAPAKSTKPQYSAAALLAQEAQRVASGRGGTVRGTGGGGTATSGPVGSGGSGTSARSTGPGRADAGYIRKVAARIRNNTNYATANMPGNTPVVYDVTLFPDGSVRSVSKRSSSGDGGFDEAVRRAVERSAPYPKDQSGRVPSGFILTHRPKG